MKQFNVKEIENHLSFKCLYHQGMVVNHEHDRCTHIGFIHSGSIKMSHYTFQGEERVLAILKKGDMFGDFLIHSSKPYYPGDLVALEDVEVSYISQNQLNELMSHHIEFQKYFLSQLSEKALRFNLHNKVLMQSSIREKVNMWLSYQPKDENGRVMIPSKEALANLFNVARPSLSRELSLMKQEGLIDYDRKYIYIQA